MKIHAFFFAVWSAVAACSAHAAFFTDEEAHNQIRQLKERMSNLEINDKQQTETIRQQAVTIKQQTVTIKQQTREVFDLQAQNEEQKNELRRLRGQDEVLANSQREADKRIKDSYIDLDTRVRGFSKLEVPVPPRPITP
ncbi:MAG: hypothetical protein ABIR84_08760 [Candidatus Nitrotoga sp.]